MHILGADACELTVCTGTCSHSAPRHGPQRACSRFAVGRAEPGSAILCETGSSAALSDIACLTEQGSSASRCPPTAPRRRSPSRCATPAARIPSLIRTRSRWTRVLPFLPGLPDLKEVVVVSRMARTPAWLFLEQAWPGAGAFDDSRPGRAGRRGCGAATWPR